MLPLHSGCYLAERLLYRPNGGPEAGWRRHALVACLRGRFKAVDRSHSPYLPPSKADLTQRESSTDNQLGVERPETPVYRRHLTAMSAPPSALLRIRQIVEPPFGLYLTLLLALHLAA